MAKIDFKKDLKHLYSCPTEVTLVDIPPMNFLLVDGQGDPNTAQEFKDAVEALYSLSYTLKFMLKKEQGLDYTVMPLEGLWWTDNMADFSQDNKDIWKWTAMIMQPEFVTGEMVGKALAEVRKKKQLPSLPKIRFESFNEGRAAQIMHIGPYAEEGPNIAQLHEFIRAKGYTFNGLEQVHHEIYLSDPRRTAPEKLKTIIRQPFTRC